jgi:hypothetical protein
MTSEEEEKNVKKKPPPEAPLKVIEVSTVVDGTGHKKADRAVKNRIIKLLNSLIDESNKDGKKNAKLAQRLMKKHNLSQELLHEEHRREASTMYATTTTVYRMNETPCLLPSSPGGVSDEDKKPAAKGSTVAEEDNDNNSDDESLSQTGKRRRLKELEDLEQAEIVLADHCEKIEKQVLKNKGIALTRDAKGNMKGHNVYPWYG